MGSNSQTTNTSLPSGGARPRTNLGPPTPGHTVQRKEVTPPLFSEVDAVKWHSFSKCFRRVAVLNGWDEISSVLRLSTSIRDNAARAIDPLDFDGFNSLDAAYAAIEEVYINPAGIEFHKATFKKAQRNEGETLLAWHTRARELFLRAYPRLSPETSDDLKDKFVLGIQDELVFQIVAGLW